MTLFITNGIRQIGGEFMEKIRICQVYTLLYFITKTIKTYILLQKTCKFTKIIHVNQGITHFWQQIYNITILQMAIIKMTARD